MLLDDIKAYLVAQGAVSAGWSIFEGFMCDDSDQTIGLFETGGFPADTLGRENEDVTFQSRVRAHKLDYATGRAKWQIIFDLLQDARQTSGSPVLLPGYIFIQAAHYGPLCWTDKGGRPNFTSNWRVKKARS
jgi:hypothetical protein